MSQRIAIVRVVCDIPMNNMSHEYGYFQYVKVAVKNVFGRCSIEYCNDPDEIRNFDHVVLTEGVNAVAGSDRINALGGISQKCIMKIQALSLHPRVYAMPTSVDYNGFLKKRGLETHIKYSILVTNNTHLIVGDSHAISLQDSISEIVHYNGKTMFGFNKMDCDPLFKDRNKVTFNFGNVDIRHHFCRNSDYLQVVEAYVAKIKRLATINAFRVAIIEPLPIECETRAIPKTGYYKGTPYFGSWEERRTVRNVAANALYMACEAEKWEYVSMGHLINAYGELDFKYMEHVRGPHIAPKYYLYADK